MSSVKKEEQSYVDVAHPRARTVIQANRVESRPTEITQASVGVRKPIRKGHLRPNAQNSSRAIDGIEWLTRALVDLPSFDAVRLGMSQTCVTGSRHFAANGRCVELCDAAQMAHDIRRYDLERDDDPSPVRCGGSIASTALPAMVHARKPVTVQELLTGTSAKRDDHTSNSKALRKDDLLPALAASSDGCAIRGGRHFDSVNGDDEKFAMDEFRFHLYRME